jgi:pimeloyl-ACP methyl ester carboxylesterase
MDLAGRELDVGATVAVGGDSATAEIGAQSLVRHLEDTVARAVGFAANPSPLDPRPCRPVVPNIGLATALLGPDGVIAANVAWDELFDGRMILPPQSRKARHSDLRAVYSIERDADGDSILVAFAQVEQVPHWPLPDAPMGRGAGVLAAIAFAPTRVSGFGSLAARVYGLDRSERHLLEALQVSDTLGDAAVMLGTTEAALRPRLRRLLDKAGVTRRSELTAGLTGLAADEIVADYARSRGLRLALGLTGSELRMAMSLRDGASVQEAAAATGVSFHTARDQCRAVLAKCRLPRLRSFARFGQEAAALVAMAETDLLTVLDNPATVRATRLVSRAGGGRICFADHGPVDGAPVVLFHSALVGRRVDSGLLVAAEERQLRLIVVERPGFGLSSKASDPARQFLESAADTARVLDRLGIARARVFARDSGVAAALTFAQQFPDRVSSGCLVSPRPPRHGRVGSAMTDMFARMLMDHPDTAIRLAGTLRRWGTLEGAHNISRAMVSHCPADMRMLEDPSWMRLMQEAIMAASARGMDGLAADLLAFNAWSIPDLASRAPWLVVECGMDRLWSGHIGPWSQLPGMQVLTLPDAGRYPFATHAPQLLDAVLALP